MRATYPWTRLASRRRRAEAAQDVLAPAADRCRGHEPHGHPLFAGAESVGRLRVEDEPELAVEVWRAMTREGHRVADRVPLRAGLGHG